MKPDRRIYLLALFIFMLLQSIDAGAQKENNIWVFGIDRGLDFNSGNPVPIRTPLRSNEGCASVSDHNGQLLFYSNGNKVWDRGNNVMPHGTGILGNFFGYGTEGSATQGVGILPFVNNEKKFYLFVLDAQEDDDAGRIRYLRYSVVDMSLNGGLGDVDSSHKNIVIDSFVSEKMTFAQGDLCAYSWLIVHSLDSPAFHCFKIDESGLNTTPVISRSGPSGTYSLGNYSQGEMKITTDFKEIGLVTFNYRYFSVPTIELHHFDAKTGIVSNYILLDSNKDQIFVYGLSFSPDNTKIYAGGMSRTGPLLLQFDLASLPDTTRLRSSKFKIPCTDSNVTEFGGMRIGPDNAIYITNVYRTNTTAGYASGMARISNPNQKTALIDFKPDIGIAYIADSADVSNMYLGIGNPVITMSITAQSHDIITCDSIKVSGALGYISYLWNDGDTSESKTVTPPAIKWVTATYGGCNISNDTFHINISPININLGNDTITCSPPQTILSAITKDANYLWQDGSTDSVFSVTQFGKYWVKVSEGTYCNTSDTISFTQEFPLSLGNKMQIICEHDSLILKTGINGASYLWQDGRTTENYTVTQTGTYWVQVRKSDCIFSDTVNVLVSKCEKCIVVPNAFTPNDDGKNDEFKALLLCPVSQYSLMIVNRYGQEIFKTDNPDKAWDGNFNNLPMDIGTYYYLIKVKFNITDSKDEIYKGDISLVR